MISTVLHEDIMNIINDNNIPWRKLRNSSVLVTGATGLIGKNIILALYFANKEKKLNLKIIAHGRDKEKMENNFKELTNITFFISDICKPLQLDENVDYIFHCASITKSLEMKDKPVDVIKTSIYGTMNILELTKNKEIKGMVFLSSMEVYGDVGVQAVTVNEKYLGNIKIDNTRSSYPESKRMCENLCYCYSIQYNTPIKVARLAQTFGAGTPIDDTRVFANFAKKAMSNKNIVLHTKGETIGNYCYLSDSVSALITILLKGDKGEIYNVSNFNSCSSIVDMAKMLAEEMDVKVDFDLKDDMGYAAVSKYKLCTDKVNFLGWKPKYNLKDMYIRMIKDWRENA